MAGHACSWAGVGAANAARNQSATRGEKAASGSTPQAYGSPIAAILHVSDISATLRADVANRLWPVHALVRGRADPPRRGLRRLGPVGAQLPRRASVAQT